MQYDAVIYALAVVVIAMSIFVGISYLLEDSTRHKHSR